MRDSTEETKISSIVIWQKLLIFFNDELSSKTIRNTDKNLRFDLEYFGTQQILKLITMLFNLIFDFNEQPATQRPGLEWINQSMKSKFIWRVVINVYFCSLCWVPEY